VPKSVPVKSPNQQAKRSKNSAAIFYWLSSALSIAIALQKSVYSGRCAYNKVDSVCSHHTANVTVLAPVEIDIEDHSNRPIDYTEEGWIEEFISEETGRMWGVQFPVT
jgi:hypothetical protein